MLKLQKQKICLKSWKLKLNNLLILYYCKKSDNELIKILNKEFKKVFIANSIKEATNSYKKYSPCIVLIDDDFNNKESVDFISKIRENDLKTAIIILSSSDKNRYFLDLIELHITKYILKPYDMNILYLAFLKCLQTIENRIYSNVKLKDNIFFNFQTQSIINNGKVIVLNKKESILLNLFIQNPNRIISYEELEYHIWNSEGTTAALKSLIRDFRKKSYKNILKNYPKIGYKLNLES